MGRCQKCQKHIDDKYVYCKPCRAKLAEKRKCAQEGCQNVISGYAKFCQTCISARTKEQRRRSAAKSREKKKNEPKIEKPKEEELFFGYQFQHLPESMHEIAVENERARSLHTSYGKIHAPTVTVEVPR